MKIKANTTKCKCTDCGAKSGSKHKTDCSETFRLNRVKHCCDECYSTYTDDDYPAHTTYDACIRQTCKCHQVDNQATINKYDALDKYVAKRAKSFLDPKEPESWEEIKDKYSQSGWFDSIREIEELDEDVKRMVRELLKKQKEEIIIKAKGYENTYDALGKFIEDLSNS